MLKTDYRKADLDDKHRAMLDYVTKLTLHPREMKQEDVERLREAGFDDRGIAEVNLVSSYFNMINRIVDGLGLEEV